MGIVTAGAKHQRGAQRLLAIGDSISSSNGAFVPTPSYSPWGWVPNSTNPYPFPSLAVGYTGGAVQLCYNAGLANAPMSIYAPAFPSTIAQWKPDLVLIELGSNDLSLGQTVAQLQASYSSALAACNAAGVKTIVLSILPRSGVSGIPAANIMLRELARAFGATFVDAYSAVTSGSASTGISGYFQVDLTHLTVNGADVVGGLVGAALRGIVGPGGQADLAQYDADPQNLLTKGLFSSGNTGGVGTGWTGAVGSSTGITPSIVAPAGGDPYGGSWQRLTGAAGNTNAYTISQAITTGFAVGDHLSVAFRVRGTGAPQLTATLTFTGAGVAANMLLGWGAQTTTANLPNSQYGPAGTGGAVFTFKDVVVPAGTTGITVSFAVNGLLTLAFTLDIGQVTVMDQTTNGNDVAHITW